MSGHYHEQVAIGCHPSSTVDIELTEEVATRMEEIFSNPAGNQRRLGPIGVKKLLDELKRDPRMATVFAYSDFPYTANNTLPVPLIEREY